MNTDLSLSLKMERMIKKANQTTIAPPKVFKSATSQEMIDDYKRSLNKPIEIDGKLYKYHPASMAVVLETPNLKYTQDIRESFTPKLLEQMLLDVRKDLYDSLDKKHKIVDDYWREHDRLKPLLELEEKKLRVMIKRREEMNRMSGRQKKRKGIDPQNTDKIIEEIKDKIDELNKTIDELRDKTVREIYDVDEEIKGAEEKENATTAQYNQFLKEKDADEVEIKRVADINQQKINEYIENLKSLNPRPINFSKGMNETDEDFLSRIDDEIKEELDPDDEETMTQAISLNRKKFLSLLDDITNDYNKKENIIGMLIKRDPITEGEGEPHNDRIFEAVKYWEPIKRYIKRRYPKDSTDINFNEYVEMIKKYLDNKEEVEKMEAQDINFEKNKEEKKTIGAINIYLSRDHYSVAIEDEQKNLLGYFKGFHGYTNPGYANEDRILILAASKTGEKGSFKRIDDEKKLKSFLKLSTAQMKGFKDIINNTDEIKDIINDQLTIDKQLKEQVYKPDTFKKLFFVSKLAAYLSARYRVQDPGRIGDDEEKGEDKLEGIRYEMKGANRDKRGVIIGAGIKKIIGRGVAEEKPNVYQKYGDILINVKKLNKNILAIKDDKERSIYGFPNKRISDFFVDMVNMSIDNIPINDNLYKGLDENEQILYDQFITLAGTRKKTKKDISASVKYLKNKYNILSGSIEAGNDNPELIKDVKLILQQLYKMDQISHKDIKNLVQNLENINK